MRYSMILPWITVVAALPQIQHDGFLSEREALAEPTYYDDYSSFHNLRRDPNFWNTVKKDAGNALHGAEQVAKTAAPYAVKYGPEVAGALMARDLYLRDPNFFHNLGQDMSSAAHTVGHGFETASAAVGPTLLQNAPQIAEAGVKMMSHHAAKRSPGFWNTVNTDAGNVGHAVAQAGAAFGPTLVQNAPQIVDAGLQILDHGKGKGKGKRDPGFWNTVKTDAGHVGHAVEHAGAAVGPTVLQNAPQIAEAGLKIMEHGKARRDPSFWETVKTDAGKALHGVEGAAKVAAPYAVKYGPEIAGAALMARDLKIEAFLARRDAEAEAEAYFEELYERDAEPEAEFEDFDGLYVRDSGYFEH